MNHAVVHLVSHHAAAAVHVHHAGLHQAIDPRPEAAEAGGQLVREHVHGAIRKVDGGAALVGRLVERRVLADVVRDVGDVHAEPVEAVRQPRQRDRVVEVTGVFAVDRHRRDLTEVGASFDIRGPHHLAQTLRLGDGVGREVLGNAEAAQDDRGVHAGRGHAAEDLDDAALGTARLAGILRQIHDDHLAGSRGQRVAPGNQHIGEHPLVERHHEAAAGAIDLQPADDPLVAARHHLHHAPFVAALGAALHARGHAIAVHRVAERARRDEQVVAGLPVAGHETDAAGRRVDGADDQVRPAWQAEEMPALPHQFARVHERREVALERHPLLTRHPQAYE